MPKSFYQQGPRTLRELLALMPESIPFATLGATLLGTVGIAAGLACYNAFGLQTSLIVGGGTAWLLISAIPFLSLATQSSDRNFSLANMPWWKPWTWAFLLVTLPWLPFWIISALRLLTIPKKYRATSRRPRNVLLAVRRRQEPE